MVLKNDVLQKSYHLLIFELLVLSTTETDTQFSIFSPFMFHIQLHWLRTEDGTMIGSYNIVFYALSA
jgi:hypothetical protein